MLSLMEWDRNLCFLIAYMNTAYKTNLPHFTQGNTISLYKQEAHGNLYEIIHQYIPQKISYILVSFRIRNIHSNIKECCLIPTFRVRNLIFDIYGKLTGILEIISGHNDKFLTHENKLCNTVTIKPNLRTEYCANMTPGNTQTTNLTNLPLNFLLQQSVCHLAMIKPLKESK